MRYDAHLVTKGWSGYELLDSGECMKLERFGEAIIARPETQALWAKNKPELWKKADAIFAFGEKKGSWKIERALPETWHISIGDIKAIVRLTSFKHTGIFPEQASNWEWVAKQVRALRSRVGTGSERGEEAHEPAKSLQVSAAKKSSGLPSGSGQTVFSQTPDSIFPHILNLFGYTGVASLVAARAGAHVTHVDSSKQSLDWAAENAKLSDVPGDKIRWILEDALAFAKREVRRGAKYDGIILDPPAFGRGAKKEVWKIEEDLPKLLIVLRELLKDTPGAFFLLNGYAAGYAPRSFAQALESAFGTLVGEAGELHLAESGSLRVIPSGIYVRFVR